MANFIHKQFSGICPATGKETTITVDFMDMTTVQSEPSYLKTSFECPNGNCSDVKKCSIYNNIPHEL